MTTPSFGGVITLSAHDDASGIHLIHIEDVATGNKMLAFGHAYFLQLFYKKCGDLQKEKQFELIYALSNLRNIRLILKINQIIEQKNMLPEKQASPYYLFEITEEMREIMSNREKIISASLVNNINPEHYLDERTDEDEVKEILDETTMKKRKIIIKGDVGECTNAWSLENQLSEPQCAADLVKIITDLNGNDFGVFISRKNGPGRGYFAHAGGFVNVGENAEEGAEREGDEETTVILETSIKKTITKIIVEEQHFRFWDPRAKFARCGTINSAVIVHIVITQ